MLVLKRICNYLLFNGSVGHAVDAFNGKLSLEQTAYYGFSGARCLERV